jgi:hypothetical protein
MMTAWIVSSLLASTPAAPEPAPAPTPEHQLELYGRMGLTVFSSSSRTQGGMGGGVGLRDTFRGQWLVQADISGLAGLGGVVETRLGGGWQRPGLWSPSARLELTTLFGQQIGFIPPGADSIAGGPTFALGVAVAPLRFSLSGTRVSLLEVSYGMGPDLGGMGTRFGLTLLEVGANF